MKHVSSRRGCGGCRCCQRKTCLGCCTGRVLSAIYDVVQHRDIELGVGPRRPRQRLVCQVSGAKGPARQRTTILLGVTVLMSGPSLCRLRFGQLEFAQGLSVRWTTSGLCAGSDCLLPSHERCSAWILPMRDKSRRVKALHRSAASTGIREAMLSVARPEDSGGNRKMAVPRPAASSPFGLSEHER